MKIGDNVVTFSSIGVIVGISTEGKPIVEWPYIPSQENFNSYSEDDLLVIETPKPNDELNPKNWSAEEEESYKKVCHGEQPNE